MIMDGIPEEIAWNTFYHMFLDSESRSALVTHCQKLASYATLEEWRSSPYGAIIRMGTDDTLVQLRRYWGLYAEFYDPAKSQRFQFLQKAMDRKRNTVLRDHGRAVHFSSSRSSGPFIAEPPVVMLFSEQFERYWKTGTTFTDAGVLKKSTHPNATFFHLRAHEGFDVHYSTDPMVPFHHAPLFGDTNRQPTIKDLVESAKSQFRGWCAAFRTAAATRQAERKPSIVLRFLLGDPLAVSRALQVWPSNASAQTEGTCTAFRSEQWSASTVDLNPGEYAELGAPVRFDVVDTSSLSDNVGMHNVFLCGAPLLANSPTAVLYTESIFARKLDPIADLQAKLFADLSVIALLLDLAPVDALSGFTTRCNTHELSMAQMTMPVAMSLDKQQCYQVLAWKRPTSGDSSASPLGIAHPPFSFDTQDFAQLLYKIYLHLFEHEDPGYVKTHSHRANPALVSAWASSWCPSRESFVTLLALIRARTRVSDAQWAAIMSAFLDIQRDDALKHHPFDALSHNDFRAQLYCYGLHPIPALDDPRRTSADASGRLSHWPTIPPLVRVFLTVPRASLAALKPVSRKLSAPAWLHCAVSLPQSQVEHLFQSVDAAYGTVFVPGAPSGGVSVAEDPDAPTAVFSFVVPGCLLVDAEVGVGVAREAIVVRLAARGTPAATKILAPVLGPDLTVFAASWEDAGHVQFAPELPLSPQPFAHVVPTPAEGEGEGEGEGVASGSGRGPTSTAIGTQSVLHVALDTTSTTGTRERIASLRRGSTSKMLTRKRASQAVPSLASPRSRRVPCRWPSSRRSCTRCRSRGASARCASRASRPTSRYVCVFSFCGCHAGVRDWELVCSRMMCRWSSPSPCRSYTPTATSWTRSPSCGPQIRLH